MSELSLLLQHLKQPEYVHVVLNHWPVEGLAAGAFALAYADLAARDYQLFVGHRAEIEDTDSWGK